MTKTCPSKPRLRPDPVCRGRWLCAGRIDRGRWLMNVIGYGYTPLEAQRDLERSLRDVWGVA